ncbi:hypothetical protein ACFWP5_37110 [Streptomyces sp. NPDC058469]|uniref:hypothetical protein n=1 Tax=Streptomyces sp. NPDC058469 TaxID=3346514 RepID=UPI003653CD0D
MRRLALQLTLCAAAFATLTSPATASPADPCDQYPSGTYAHADCVAQHECH